MFSYVFLFLFYITQQGKEFLEKEKKRLLSEKVTCSLKKVTLRTLDNLRLSDKVCTLYKNVR